MKTYKIIVVSGFGSLEIVSDTCSEQIKHQAEEFKAKGNAQLRKNNHREAIEWYTKAIDLIPQSAVYHGNRSQAKFNIHEFEGALEDASKAITCDPAYLKGYYRKAIATMGLGNYESALAWFQSLQRKLPNDINIEKNMQECKTMIFQQGNYNQI